MCRFNGEIGEAEGTLQKAATGCGQVCVTAALVFCVATLTILNWRKTSLAVATGLAVSLSSTGLACFLVVVRMFAKQRSYTVNGKSKGIGHDENVGELLSKGEFVRQTSLESNHPDTPAKGVLTFPVSTPDVPVLNVPEEQAAWFAQEVFRIYAVDNSAPGSSCGEALKPLQKKLPGDLTPLFRQLRAAFEPGKPEAWKLHEPLDDVFFARKLVATDFDVSKSIKLARNYVEFRQSHGGGCVPPSTWQDLGLAIMPFEDRRGRPVVIMRPRFHDPQTQSPKYMEEGVRGILDAVIAHLLFKRNGRISESNPLEQYVLIIDTEGVSFKNFSMKTLGTMIRESTSRYPDRLSQVVVLGINTTVSGIFAIASKALHPRTKKKISMVRRSEVHSTMRELVDPDLLPPEYGGTGPTLTTPSLAESSDLAGSVGAIMASVWDRLGIDPQGGVSRVRVALADTMKSGNGLAEPSFLLWIQEPGESSSMAQKRACQRSISECGDLIQRVRCFLTPGGVQMSRTWGECFTGVVAGVCSMRSVLPPEARTANGLQQLLNGLVSQSPEAKDLLYEFVRRRRSSKVELSPPKWWPPES